MLTILVADESIEDAREIVDEIEKKGYKVSCYACGPERRRAQTPPYTDDCLDSQKEEPITEWRGIEMAKSLRDARANSKLIVYAKQLDSRHVKELESMSIPVFFKGRCKSEDMIRALRL